MRVSQCVKCSGFPCKDVKRGSCIVPSIQLEPGKIFTVLISEAAPARREDYYYSGGESLYQQTTVQAFNDAGVNVSSVDDLLSKGIYLSTAVKCAKTEYALQTDTVRNCSFLLENELSLFPNVKVLLLMGDVAIKGFNHVAKRKTGKAAIPAGATYKIRREQHFYDGVRVFPSYLQAGPSFFIEKSKRRMIAEDLASAMRLIS